MSDILALPRGMPARLIAGDTWGWISEVPVVEGVNLAVFLRLKSGGNPVVIDAVTEDNRRVLRMQPRHSARIIPGLYLWTEIATRPADGARWTANEGRVDISPDPAASGGDMRSHAERILEAIDARLVGRVTEDCDAYTIEGRSITRTPLDVLMRVRGVYARQVAAQNGRGGVQFQGVTFR